MCNCEYMIKDRQTRRQTNTVSRILCSFIRCGVKIIMYHQNSVKFFWGTVYFDILLSSALRCVLQAAHKTFIIKRKLGRKQKQNRPIPQWVRMKTGNKIRYIHRVHGTHAVEFVYFSCILWKWLSQHQLLYSVQAAFFTDRKFIYYYIPWVTMKPLHVGFIFWDTGLIFFSWWSLMSLVSKYILYSGRSASWVTSYLSRTLMETLISMLSTNAAD